MLKGLNWVGVIAGFVYAELLGYVWYAVVFAAKLKGMMPASATSPTGYAEGALISLITVIGTAWLVKKSGTAGYVAGAIFGAAVWFFLPFMGEMSNYVYAGKTMEMIEIDAGFMLLFLAGVGALTAGLKLGKSAA